MFFFFLKKNVEINYFQLHLDISKYLWVKLVHWKCQPNVKIIRSICDKPKKKHTWQRRPNKENTVSFSSCESNELDLLARCFSFCCFILAQNFSYFSLVHWNFSFQISLRMNWSMKQTKITAYLDNTNRTKANAFTKVLLENGVDLCRYLVFFCAMSVPVYLGWFRKWQFHWYWCWCHIVVIFFISNIVVLVLLFLFVCIYSGWLNISFKCHRTLEFCVSKSNDNYHIPTNI